MKYTSNYNRRGKVERVLDLIWNIITVKGAVTAVASYCSEKLDALSEAKERYAERRNEVKKQVAANPAIMAAVAVSIVMGICTAVIVTNSQANSRLGEARARADYASKQLDRSTRALTGRRYNWD